MLQGVFWISGLAWHPPDFPSELQPMLLISWDSFLFTVVEVKLTLLPTFILLNGSLFRILPYPVMFRGAYVKKINKKRSRTNALPAIPLSSFTLYFFPHFLQ